jgi:alkanesulfonate monooxygenase SsuD/methylene tetrahydromethanopterin reductase-like flavin-dependent oxidoreductase (luciferase family)
MIAGSHPGRSTEAWQQALGDIVEQAQLAERLGFHSLVFAEHHFENDGLEAAPNPLLLAAWVGSHTRSIRLGTLGVQIPAWNPVRLAEDIAMVDQMLQGRLDVGIVRGPSWPQEVEQHGQAYGLQVGKPGTPEEAANQEIYKEHYDIVIELLTKDAVRLQTKHWQLPRDGTAMPDVPAAHWRKGIGERLEGPEGAGWGLPVGMRRVESLSLVPAPYQKPHPPFFAAFIRNTETIRWAARQGIKVVSSENDASKFSQIVHLYDEARDDAARDGNSGCGICLGTYFYVSEKEDDVERVAEPTLFWSVETFVGGALGTQFPGETERHPFTWDRFLTRYGWGKAVGTPAQVYEKLSEFIAETGVDHVFLMTGADLVPHKEMMNSIRLFGEEVLPRL